MTTDHLSNDILNFLTLDTTRDFLVAANKFVTILERSDLEKNDFIRQVHKALIDLYSTGQQLQKIDLIYSNSDTDFNRDDFFEDKNKNLISEFGEQAFYWEIFDPTYTEKNGEPNLGWKITDRESSQGWLVDDFSDIYRDIKIELEKLKLGTNEATEDALWQLKFSFQNHWGGHCINALRYLHYFWYDNKL